LLPSLFLTLPATSQIYTLSLHDALPISSVAGNGFIDRATQSTEFARRCVDDAVRSRACRTGLRKLRSASNYWRIALRRLSSSSTDRKSTRLNSSHVKISYAVFCLKKKKK